jgi:hypothetical protein
MSYALQLDRRLRWSLYAAFAVLFATGAAWLLADQLKDSADGEFWQATIANVLMVHGGAASFRPASPASNWPSSWPQPPGSQPHRLRGRNARWVT